MEFHHNLIFLLLISLFLSMGAFLNDASASGLKNKPRIISNSLKVNAKLPRSHYITSFPDEFRGGRFPQSINLSPNQRYLYLGFDSYRPDGSKMAKYNLRTRHFSTGPTFNGGHAQGVTLNNNHLWLINKSNNDDGDDHSGVMNHGRFVEVSTQSLRPVYSRKFHTKPNYYFNNTLASTKSGVFMAVRAKYNSKAIRNHMLIFFRTPSFNRHGFKWQRLNTIIHRTPANAITEFLAYNPHNNHLYYETETPNELWSLPLTKLTDNTLSKHDIKIARMSSSKEPEGIAFTKSGYAYMMFGGRYPWRGYIYKTNRPLSF